MRLRFVIVAALSWLSIMSADVQGADSHAREIDALIEKIKHAPDSGTRSDLARISHSM